MIGMLPESKNFEIINKFNSNAAFDKYINNLCLLYTTGQV